MSETVSDSQLAALELAQYLRGTEHEEAALDFVPDDDEDAFLESDAPHRELWVHHLTDSQVETTKELVEEWIQNTEDVADEEGATDASLDYEMEVNEYANDHPGKQVWVHDICWDHEQ